MSIRIKEFNSIKPRLEGVGPVPHVTILIACIILQTSVLCYRFCLPHEEFNYSGLAFISTVLSKKLNM